MGEWKPRGRDVKLGDVPWLARIADKARAKVDDTIGEYIYPCPIDRRFLEEAGMSAEEFMELASTNRSDDALEMAFKSRSKRKDWTSFQV